MTAADSALKALVIDDDALVAQSIADFLVEEGFSPTVAHSVSEARDALQRHGPFAVALVDVSMPDEGASRLGPGEGGMTVLRELIRSGTGVAPIMMTGMGSIESAVESLRTGAVDYLTKPIADRELRVSLERAKRQHALLCENVQLRQRLESKAGLDAIAGHDPRMLRTMDMVRAVAPSKTTVLMCGESGTGKSLIARAIHDQSPRRERPFVELSCGSIPETLLESELFGHIKGAFTGAHADKVGRFKAADGGTLFLDEINSASPGMQLKLLRVLQERKFEPVGSTLTLETDVRIVLATNQPLERLVAQGHFRQDLYYRINVVKIELPPLRDRPGDVALLAARFLAQYAAQLGKQIVGFAPDAMHALETYDFPGNVRELQNIAERAAVLCTGQTVTRSDLPPAVLGEEVRSVAFHEAPASTPPAASVEDEIPWIPMTLDEALREPERRILLRALTANHWNRQKTADQLQINRTTLYKKLKALGLDHPERHAG